MVIKTGDKGYRIQKEIPLFAELNRLKGYTLFHKVDFEEV